MQLFEIESIANQSERNSIACRANENLNFNCLNALEYLIAFDSLQNTYLKRQRSTQYSMDISNSNRPTLTYYKSQRTLHRPFQHNSNKE